VKYTRLATDIAPANIKITDLAHQADALYALGALTRDADSSAQGRKELEDVVTQYPIFGYLTLAPVYTAQPTSSPDFAIGLESLFLMFEACTGSKIDRDHPDVTPMLGALSDPDCGNGKAHIPHNLEGTLLMFGDTLVKIGKPEDARRVFETLTKTHDYPTWAFHSSVESRLASDLRVIPANGHPCLSCHQR
jgi:hypothetical protein